MNLLKTAAARHPWLTLVLVHSLALALAWAAAAWVDSQVGDAMSPQGAHMRLIPISTR
jgi:hypothetical protein